MSLTKRIILSAVLIGLGVAGRVLPHAWNFTPLVAIALFSGYVLGLRRGTALTLVSMLLGDCLIGFYQPQLMLAVYGSLALAVCLSLVIRKFEHPAMTLLSGLTASSMFFLVTNWAVWQFSPWYAKSLSGLLQCYVLALPFFRNALMGDLFYTAALFGVYEISLAMWQKRAQRLQAKLPNAV